jgi:hypothetical protein
MGRSFPAKSEMGMSTRWHGVSDVELQANARQLGEPKGIHHADFAELQVPEVIPIAAPASRQHAQHGPPAARKR